MPEETPIPPPEQSANSQTPQKEPLGKQYSKHYSAGVENGNI